MLAVQEEQLEQAVSNAAAETDAKLVQEMQQREESLSNALLEARASLGNMQRLHQASQNQLFTIQSQTEEQEVCQRAFCISLSPTQLCSYRPAASSSLLYAPLLCALL